MPKKVLVAGSINTDLVVRTPRAPEAGETVTGTAFDIYGGGKGANQAFAAARSGSMTTMLGAVGKDEFGVARLRDLEQEGIKTTHVEQFAGVPSGVALITVEESGQNRIVYVPGATMSVSPERASLAVAAVMPDLLLATLELPGAALQRLFEESRKAGAMVICNATPEPLQQQSLALSAEILIVNETEALELLGLEEATVTWIALAHQLSERGPAIVVITLGEAGAVIVTPEGEETLPSLPVTVIDTTGAGDAFCGAFAAVLAATSDPFQAARSGVVAGSLAVTKAGAQPSIPFQPEIEKALRSING